MFIMATKLQVDVLSQLLLHILSGFSFLFSDRIYALCESHFWILCLDIFLLNESFRFELCIGKYKMENPAFLWKSINNFRSFLFAENTKISNISWLHTVDIERVGKFADLKKILWQKNARLPSMTLKIINSTRARLHLKCQI